MFKDDEKGYFAMNLTLMIAGMVLIALSIGILGFCVFYITNVSMELPNWIFSLFIVVAEIVFAVYCVKATKILKDLKRQMDGSVK